MQLKINYRFKRVMNLWFVAKLPYLLHAKWKIIFLEMKCGKGSCYFELNSECKSFDLNLIQSSNIGGNNDG